MIDGAYDSGILAIKALLWLLCPDAHDQLHMTGSSHTTVTILNITAFMDG
jgi:hypothetical protein